MTRVRSVLILVFPLLIFTAGSVQAQWQEQVNNYLETASSMARDEGLRQMEEPRTGSLDAGEEESQSLSLQSGNHYMMVAVCDNDCTDIDLRLYGPNGDQIDVDVELDDTPIVDVAPGRSGTYRLEVVMVTCSTEPCFYGVGIYGSGSGGGGQSSDGNWQEVVDRQLDRIRDQVGSEGLRRLEGNRTGSLDESERESLTITLQPSTEFMIVGACDQDCSDLDLRLYDQNDNEIDVDIELDDTPIVTGTTSSKGSTRYRLQVVMVTCSTEPCFYGVGIYGTGGGKTDIDPAPGASHADQRREPGYQAAPSRSLERRTR